MVLNYRNPMKTRNAEQCFMQKKTRNMEEARMVAHMVVIMVRAHHMVLNYRNPMKTRMVAHMVVIMVRVHHMVLNHRNPMKTRNAEQCFMQKKTRNMEEARMVAH